MSEPKIVQCAECDASTFYGESDRLLPAGWLLELRSTGRSFESARYLCPEHA